MTNEEAIKELREASDSEVRYGDTEHHYNEVMKRIEAFEMAIKALEQEPKWIPVSERFPDKEGCYLVTTTGTNNDIIDIAYYVEGIWHKASRIKAWMPLPKLYEPQESEDKEGTECR